MISIILKNIRKICLPSNKKLSIDLISEIKTFAYYETQEILFLKTVVIYVGNFRQHGILFLNTV